MTFHGLIDKAPRDGVQYAWELNLLNRYRSWDDGLSLIEFDVDFSWYKGDHQPSYGFNLVIANWTIIEFKVYNTQHWEGGDD